MHNVNGRHDEYTCRCRCTAEGSALVFRYLHWEALFYVHICFIGEVNCVCLCHSSHQVKMGGNKDGLQEKDGAGVDVPARRLETLSCGAQEQFEARALMSVHKQSPLNMIALVYTWCRHEPSHPGISGLQVRSHTMALWKLLGGPFCKSSRVRVREHLRVCGVHNCASTETQNWRCAKLNVAMFV